MIADVWPKRNDEFPNQFMCMPPLYSDFGFFIMFVPYQAWGIGEIRVPKWLIWQATLRKLYSRKGKLMCQFTEETGFAVYGYEPLRRGSIAEFQRGHV